MNGYDVLGMAAFGVVAAVFGTRHYLRKPTEPRYVLALASGAIGCAVWLCIAPWVGWL